MPDEVLGNDKACPESGVPGRHFRLGASTGAFTGKADHGFALPRPLRPPGWLASWASALILGFLSISACGTGSSEPGTSIDEGSVVAGLAGVEIEITNAVAPFDHASNVDSLLTEMRIAQNLTPPWFECLAAQGFPRSPTSFALPDRADPILMANAAFPDTARLAIDGFPAIPGIRETPATNREVSAAETSALEFCAGEISQSDASQIQVLFGTIRGAWQGTLDEIDASEEVHALLLGFGTCLQNEGIPAAYTAGEVPYLSYVDYLLANTGDDLDAMTSIQRRYGMLYAECGYDLFEAREELRSGDLRSAFLRKHEAAIRTLNNALYGGS